MKTVLWFPNERVDLGDMEALTSLHMDDILRRNRALVLPAGRAIGSTNTPTRLLSGFHFDGWTPDGSSVVTLNRGTGVFLFWDEGELKLGMVLGEWDPAEYDIDVSGMSNGTYALWVRFVYTSAEFENRVFWDALTSSEDIDNVTTRSVPSWEYVMQASTAAPPGHGEWVKIWEIQVQSGVVHTMTDYRHNYFEGAPVDSYADEWGDESGQRSADRIQYGVKDQHMWNQLVRRQLQDIIGVKHYTVPPRTLTEVAAEHKVGGSHGAVIADSVWSRQIVAYPPTNDTTWELASRAFIGNGESTNRGVKAHGHLVKPHDFFDDFFYVGDASGYIHTQAAGMPWGFRAVGGGTIPGNNAQVDATEIGGCIHLHAEDVQDHGIEMISGYNASLDVAMGWWNLSVRAAAGMFRFKTPADITEFAIIFGMAVSGDFQGHPSAYARYVDDSGGGGTSGQLQGNVRGSGGVSAGVPLVTLAADTWYTVRWWTKNSTQISFQVNNGTAIDVASPDTVQSGDYCLFFRLCNSFYPDGDREVIIDQAFACEGQLWDDMI